MKTLIRGGRVLDPESGYDKIADIMIDDNVVVEIAENISDEDADSVIDASGDYVMPGFVDLHAHLREPGFEHKETIRTGTRAAARGGFTTICCMPNTRPVMDNVEIIKYVIEKAEDVSSVNVLPVAAVTAAEEGEYLTDFDALKDAGAVAVSEDINTVMDSRVARQAMRLAAEVDIPVFAHCEDKSLAKRGVMNAGNRAKELGFYGILDSAEETMVARDLILAKNTGARLHVCHVTTKDSAELIKFAKEKGLPVTCEVTAHHLILTDNDIDGSDADFKICPPLRDKDDVEGLRRALADGVIDCICTDHAPHHKTEKDRGFLEAPFGASALETTVSLIWSELVEKGLISPIQMAEKMSLNPAKVLRLDKGVLQAGRIADITIIDPNDKYVIDSTKFASLGKNTPFEGREVKGSVKYTIVAGKVVYAHKDGNETIVDKDIAKL